LARILCIDYGLRRCGIAVTDPLQIIVNGLEAITQEELHRYLIDYCSENPVEKIVLGYPLQSDGSKTPVSIEVEKLKSKLEQILPQIEVVLFDEKKSSQEAMKIIVKSGVNKKKRSDKSLLDKMSAVIILQKYLGHI